MKFGQEFDRVRRLHLVAHLAGLLAAHGQEPLTKLLELSTRYPRLRSVTLGELVSAGTRQPPEPSDTAILTQLRAFGQWVPSAVVASRLGLSVPKMRARLHRLIQARQVDVQGHARGTRYKARRGS